MGLTKVLERGQIIEVDESSVSKCTVCLRYKDKSSFGEPRSRTNCEECYHLSSAEWSSVMEEAKKEESKKNPQWELLQRRKVIENNTLSKEELILVLQKLPDGSRIGITQNGYYCDGEFASIFFPQKQEDGLYIIGDSSQSA